MFAHHDVRKLFLSTLHLGCRSWFSSEVAAAHLFCTPTSPSAPPGHRDVCSQTHCARSGQTAKRCQPWTTVEHLHAFLFLVGSLALLPNFLFASWNFLLSCFWYYGTNLCQPKAFVDILWEINHISVFRQHHEKTVQSLHVGTVEFHIKLCFLFLFRLIW